MKDVSGKTAFVTGGASGIGLGMAKVFSWAGMNVVAADVREDHIAAAHDEIADEGLAERVRFLRLDVTDREAFAAAADEAEARGVGAYTVDGEMVDAPFVLRARAVLATARRMGLD